MRKMGLDMKDSLLKIYFMGKVRRNLFVELSMKEISFKVDLKERGSGRVKMGINMRDNLIIIQEKALENILGKMEIHTQVSLRKDINMALEN